MPESLDATNEGDGKTIEHLREVLGDFFAEKLYGDKGWVLGILSSIKQQS
jgi:transcription initiation factor TFIID subunit 6